MEFLKDDTTHVVVMFDGERRKRQKVIDLVPRTWLTCFEEDIIFCSYPPDKDCDYVNEWAKKMVAPDPTWRRYRVTVRKEAVGYKQGIRRLERAYAATDVESTDVDTRPESRVDLQPEVLSDAEVWDQLNAETFSLAKNPLNKKSSTSSANKDQPSSGTLCKPQNPIKKQNVPNNQTEEAALHKYLAEMELRFMQKVEGLKRSILYDLNHKVDELKATLTFNHPVESRNITRNREILGFQLPITTLAEFIRFNLELVKEDKNAALKSLMEILAAGTNSISDDLGKIFSATIHKDVQLQYSAVGRKLNGVGKKNFSETKFYQLLQDVLLQKHETVTAPILISKLSRFLSGATDRNNGRRNRGVVERVRRAEQEAIPEAESHAVPGAVVEKVAGHDNGPRAVVEQVAMHDNGPKAVVEQVAMHDNGLKVVVEEVARHDDGPEAVREVRVHAKPQVQKPEEVRSQAGLKVAAIDSSEDDSKE